jgi:endonuclease G
LSDYSGSGFDREHMAPAGDMKRSTRVMSESFLLSNMAPQVGIGFNRHIWENLESTVRGWVQQRGKLIIITGPVFILENGQVTYQVIGDNYVAVPTHFYQIVVDANDANNVNVLAFLLPNESLTGRHYSEFLTSVDEIERLTGLNFLEKLPDQIENKIEALIVTEVW